MPKFYQKIVCVHALDPTTSFLSSLSTSVSKYLVIESSKKSLDEGLAELRSIPSGSLIIFAGHGNSKGLYLSESGGFPKTTLIDAQLGNEILKDNDVLLLSCRSAEFISSISTYNSILGFGNIISSLDELSHEMVVNGYMTDLEEDDICYFNSTYVSAIAQSVKLVASGRHNFSSIPNLISFFLNKEINALLRGKTVKNRIEIARLIFDFKDEMTYRRRNLAS